MRIHLKGLFICVGATFALSCSGGLSPSSKPLETASTKNAKVSSSKPGIYPGLKTLRAAYERILNGRDTDYVDRGVLIEISKSVQERTIVTELASALLPCKSREECPTAALHPETARLIGLGFSILGETGHVRSVPSLVLFDRLGFHEAGIAALSILERQAGSQLSTGSCVPPTVSDVTRQGARLEGFAVFDWQRDRLIARELLPEEKNDLAYFFSAVLQNGREIRNLRAVVAESERPLCPATPMDDALKALSRAMQKFTFDHEPSFAVRAAQDFAEALLSKRIDVDDTPCLGAADVQSSVDFRDAASISEALGLLNAADFLYRVAIPGGGACTTSDDSFWALQVKGLIRVSERAGRCNRVTAERMLSIDGPVEEWNLFDYGPQRLALAGYDLRRLYRGALLTRNREYLSSDSDAAFDALPPSLRAAVRNRFRNMGAEDWERRTFAVEGLIDTLRRPALTETVDLIDALHPKSRQRGIFALGEFAHRIYIGECAKDESSVTGESSNAWVREIRPLGFSCPERLSDQEADALAAKIIPYLDDPEPSIRMSAVSALEKIASFSSIIPLRKTAANRPAAPSSCPVCERADKAARRIESLFTAAKK